jgi:hypothetical protein
MKKAAACSMSWTVRNASRGGTLQRSGGAPRRSCRGLAGLDPVRTSARAVSRANSTAVNRSTPRRSSEPLRSARTSRRYAAGAGVGRGKRTSTSTCRRQPGRTLRDRHNTPRPSANTIVECHSAGRIVEVEYCSTQPLKPRRWRVHGGSHAPLSLVDRDGTGGHLAPETSNARSCGTATDWAKTGFSLHRPEEAAR